jgi:hypothetical protein
MNYDNDHLIQRFEALWSERKTVEQQWQDIERFIAPYKGRFFQQNSGEHSIEWQETRQVYDATAVQASIQLASSIHGALTNPAIRWFEMQWRDPDLRDNYNASTWIEKAGKRVFDELQDSNFNLEANNVYRNLTSFATAAIVEEPVNDFTEAWGGVKFMSIPIKQVYFEPGADGQVVNFYRHMQWRASKIVDKFGLDNVPDRVKALYEVNSDEPIDMVFVVFTRHDKLNQTDPLLTPENRPYGFRYILRDGRESVGTDGGYYEMPAYIPRWELTDESMWGCGPAHYAIADVLTLNKMVQLDLMSREKVIDPATLIQERALIMDLDLGPGAQNVVRDPEGIKAFESAARFDAVEATVVRLQMAVRKYFYIDQLELKESPAMTATEVQVRYELMQRLLSSTMARLKEDFLDPLLQRTFNLLYRAGELGELPEGIELSDYDIEYIGPLSRSMKFDQSASIERWITQLQLIAQMGGEAEKVMLVPDYDKIARASAANLNLPTELTRDPKDVEKDMERQRQLQDRQASANAAQAEAAAVKDLGQAQDFAQSGDQNVVPISQ